MYQEYKTNTLKPNLFFNTSNFTLSLQKEPKHTSKSKSRHLNITTIDKPFLKTQPQP